MSRSEPRAYATWTTCDDFSAHASPWAHNERVVPGGKVRRLVVVGFALLLLGGITSFQVADRAGAELARCQQHRSDARERASSHAGDGASTLVIGDSWSVGLGLDALSGSWPAQLGAPDDVRVAGFSGSGFSARASGCGRVSFADRAPTAVSARPDLVVVEGGLNDHDQPTAAVERGFDDLMRALAAQRVVVVGPASAPARAGAVPRVDALLARLCTTYAVPYVVTSDLDLDYLDDSLHLTLAGHEEFGDAVAERVAGVTPTRPAVPTR